MEGTEIADMTDVEKANIILHQLGGNKFIAMTGSKDFIALENGLRIEIGAKYQRREYA